MSRELKIGLTALVIAALAVWGASFLRNYPGAREAPSPGEAALARRLRSWAVPSEARQKRNPFTSSPELLQEVRRHFADHCASCHGNDGAGAREMGRNLFPRAPDMRQAATQQLSDGELYSIIHNGVRWTGMPAWGNADDDPDSWKLALFIRHLPQLSAEEIREMERYNPKSAAEREEENEEEEFLNGGPNPGPSGKHDHTLENKP